MSARRWILVATAFVSLAFVAWAGILLAFSVPIDAHAAALDPELAAADRAIVAPPPSPPLVATHLTAGKDAAWLVAGTPRGNFPTNAENVSLVLALAYVAPQANGTYEPANLTLLDVPTANGTVNLTLDAATLAGGARGFLALDPRDGSARFVATDALVGEVIATETTSALTLRFILGSVGVLLPILALVLGRRAARPVEGACPECHAPLGPSASFCLRCGAYATEAPRDA